MNPTTRERILLTLRAAVLFFAGAGVATFVVVGVMSNSQSAPVQTITAAPPLENTEPAEITIVPSAKALDPVAVELVPGSKGNQYDATYRCKEGYQVIQVPVGKTEWKDGSKFTLDEERPYYGQERVIFKVTLSNEWIASGIINTAAHNKAPNLYPQHKLFVNMPAGSTASWPFQTRAYANNYETVGITDITVCLAPAPKG
ncbi:MAG TPA: hypothetical protein VFT87_05220 [Candidatus Saccharimonadales bacterium]|nr:hypothetical protein [Candidatus Saccharimonadales bacterium]